MTMRSQGEKVGVICFNYGTSRVPVLAKDENNKYKPVFSKPVTELSNSAPIEPHVKYEKERSYQVKYCEYSRGMK